MKHPSKFLIILIALFIGLLAIFASIISLPGDKNRIIGTYFYICEDRYIPNGIIRDNTFTTADIGPMNVITPVCHFNYFNTLIVTLIFIGVSALSCAVLWKTTYHKI